MAETNILRLFETSQKLRVKEARDIPGREVNFVDVSNTYQDGWKNYQEIRKTTFTSDALEYYTAERKQLVIPESWVPVEEGITLNRWGPGNGYYRPGSPPGS